MEIPSNPANKQNAVETSDNTQALLEVTAMPPTLVSGEPTPVALAPTPPPPGVVGPVTDPLRRSTSSDTSMKELSPALLGAMQLIVSAAIREQVAVLAHARVVTPSNTDAPEEEAEGDISVPVPSADTRQGAPLLAPQDVPPKWLARFECLQKDLRKVGKELLTVKDKVSL
ncbi:UNVERIFIED_CONTAM: hypothetical protein Sradi_3175300 [Sesamum radiatum]|uniref:Uncharacterized protein n=1 Tax=Sesamum radiatum TaxID=300843 RepID=A0AAW2RFQ5_SESRA